MYTKTEWIEYFTDRGLPANIIEDHLNYIQPLINNNIPVIFEFEHLSKLIGINRTIFARIVNAPEYFYRTFTIPKRRGGKRIIHAPYTSLLTCQNWIYKNILLTSKIHPAANGFAPNKSIITNAKQHLQQKCLLKMDLLDFFPSIPMRWVINYFKRLGYAHNVTFYLSSICCYDDGLAQGAPTSPYLSNILLYNLDNRLERLSNSYSLIYTRYADDMAFSGKYIPHHFIQIVGDIIGDFDLSVNDQKTKLHTKSGRKIVTGISVAGTILRLPKKTKRQLRKKLHYVKKYGLLSQINKFKISNPRYLDSLIGKFQFWNQVEPENKFAINGLDFLKDLKEQEQEQEQEQDL